VVIFVNLVLIDRCGLCGFRLYSCTIGVRINGDRKLKEEPIGGNSI